MQGRPKMLVKN